METKIIQKKKVRFFFLLCAIIYLVGYLNRQNYGAVLVEIISAEGFAKTTASMALTGLFVAYGIGQLVSGVLGDHIRPARVVGVGIFVSGLMNLLIPLCQSAVAMTVVWCVNGFAQAMLWPPIVKMMSVRLAPEEYTKKVFWVSSCGNIGTMIIYVVAPLTVMYTGWRGIFLFSGCIALVMGMVWFLGNRMVDKWTAPIQAGKHQKSTAEPVEKIPLGTSSVLILTVVGLAIVLQGIVRDGILSWLPTYFAETFHMDSSKAIFSGLLMPVFAIASTLGASWLYRNVIHNEMIAAVCFYAVMAVGSALVRIVGASAPVVSLLCLTLAGGAASGANMLLIAQVPSHFKNTGHISTIAGVMNACTYVGSTIATYGIAVVTEKHGWNASLLVWALAAAVGGALCLALMRKWKLFLKNEL